VDSEEVSVEASVEGSEEEGSEEEGSEEEAMVAVMATKETLMSKSTCFSIGTTSIDLDF
jgi:hypothetical protein